MPSVCMPSYLIIEDINRNHVGIAVLDWTLFAAAICLLSGWLLVIKSGITSWVALEL